jgi:hypothetical protein
MYLEYHSVCPLVGIGTLPLSLPEPKGGGTNSTGGEGVGESYF